MRRHLARLLGLLSMALIAIVWLSTASGVSAGDPCYHDFTIPTPTTETSTQIKLMPCAFAPTVTQVAPGTTVTFFNGPDFTHLITGANQAWGSRDAEVRPNETISYTFDKAGIYPFACALHRGMSGTILVGDVKTASAAGTPATGAAAGATTGGATTGGATSGGTGTAGTPMDELGPAVVAGVAGVLIGAAAVLVTVRPRRSGEDPTSPQTA
jgi:plastocyanin